MIFKQKLNVTILIFNQKLNVTILIFNQKLNVIIPKKSMSDLNSAILKAREIKKKLICIKHVSSEFVKKYECYLYSEDKYRDIFKKELSLLLSEYKEAKKELKSVIDIILSTGLSSYHIELWLKMHQAYDSLFLNIVDGKFVNPSIDQIIKSAKDNRLSIIKMKSYAFKKLNNNIYIMNRGKISSKIIAMSDGAEIYFITSKGSIYHSDKNQVSRHLMRNIAVI